MGIDSKFLNVESYKISTITSLVKFFLKQRVSEIKNFLLIYFKKYKFLQSLDYFSYKVHDRLSLKVLSREN